MKAYRKELNSLEDLRRERIRLKAELKHSSSGDFLNPFSKTPGKKVTSRAKEGFWGTVGDLVSADSRLQTAIAVGKPLLKMLGKRRKASGPNFIPARHRANSALVSIAKEIITGYLLGKSVQLSFRGIKALIRKNKKRRYQQ